MRYKNTDAVPVKEQAKEYIEREALLKKIFPYNAADKKEYTINAYAVEKAIKEAPAADMVEVVRCKDCKYCEILFPVKEIGKEAVVGYKCLLIRTYKNAEGFCDYGKRREK